MARPPVYLSEAEEAPAMLGAAEVAALLGITPSRVKQLAHSADFPPPVVRLSMGTAWYREDVEAWAAANAERRALRDPRKNQEASA
jgi:predicted DNA-binding transcriptional regulator AlpA